MTKKILNEIFQTIRESIPGGVDFEDLSNDELAAEINEMLALLRTPDGNNERNRKDLEAAKKAYQKRHGQEFGRGSGKRKWSNSN